MSFESKVNGKENFSPQALSPSIQLLSLTSGETTERVGGKDCNIDFYKWSMRINLGERKLGSKRCSSINRSKAKPKEVVKVAVLPLEISVRLADSCLFLLQASSLEKQRPIKEGSISILTGFLPSSPIPTSMPLSHQAWELVARALPALLRSYNLVKAIDQMPLLKADFPECYLDRASMLISALAHAYCFQEKKPLPNQLELPWQEITTRLERPRVMRSASDDFLHNWRCKDSYIAEPMQIDNLETLFPYFSEPEDGLMSLTVTLTEHCFAPALKHVVEAQNAVLKEFDDDLIYHLQMLCKVVRKVTGVFSHISPNQNSPYYVDPVVWAKTFAIIGSSTRDSELGNSGIALPSFHVMDAFIGRTEFETELGSQMIERSNDLPGSIKKFIELINTVSVRSYVKSSKNPQLIRAFDNLIEAYAGEGGLLNVHRRKAYGYIKLAMQSGRTTTNNENVGKKSEEEASVAPWLKINEQLVHGRNERSILRCNGTYHSVRNKIVKKIGEHAYQITFLLDDNVINWVPGDKLSVIPENSSSDIEAVMKNIPEMGPKKGLRLNLPDNWKKWFREVFGQNLQNIDLQTFLKYADLQHVEGIAERRFVSKPALMPQDTTSTLSLLPIPEREGLAEFFDTMRTENLSQELLREDSPYYLPTLLKPLQDRLYSVTTINKEDKTISLTVGAKPNAEKAQCPFQGTGRVEQKQCPFTGKVASSYLAHPSDNSKISHVPSYDFILPKNPNAKIAMFAAGTGIAPFIGFIQNASAHSKLHLYYSVQSDGDFLHKRQLLAWAAQGRIDLKVVFTREGRSIEYENGVSIQRDFNQEGIHIDKLLNGESEQAVLSKLLEDPSGYFYVCGSTGFYKTVQNSLSNSLAFLDKPSGLLYKLAAEQRYVVEVYDASNGLDAPSKFTMSDVAMHNKMEECWVVINNKVFDFSKYIQLHPGGAKIVMALAGLDGTRDFEAIHSKEQGIYSQIKMFCIGELEMPNLLEENKESHQRNLNKLLTLVSHKNNVFNNSFFNGREVAFRLFDRDWMSFFVNNMQELELNLLRKSTMPGEVKSEFNSTIEAIKNDLSADLIKTENRANSFIKGMWQVNENALEELQRAYHSFLKAVESPFGRSGQVQGLEQVLEEEVSAIFKAYWNKLQTKQFNKGEYK